MSINKCNQKGRVILNSTHFIPFTKKYYEYHCTSPGYLMRHEIRSCI